MGHYASEMQCDKCHRMRCVCLSILPKVDWSKKFTFLSDYSRVVNMEEYVDDYLKKGGDPKMVNFVRFTQKTWSSREEADKHRRECIVHTLESFNAQAKKLNALLKDFPPSTEA